MTKSICTAFAVLLLMPLSAQAAAQCRHERNHGLSQEARGDHHATPAASLEIVPTTLAAVPCPDHPNQPCKINVGIIPKCSMEVGCCIKADGPLSTGLNNRAPTNDDQALSLSTNQVQPDGRLVDAAPYRYYPQRNLPAPDPRPPLI